MCNTSPAGSELMQLRRLGWCYVKLEQGKEVKGNPGRAGEAEVHTMQCIAHHAYFKTAHY